jgi:hypothetical protein
MGGTGRRIRIVFAVTFAALALVPTPAEAKGATDVTVFGPGLATPIRFGSAGDFGSSANRLWQASGLLVQTPDRVTPNMPQNGALGPRYLATFQWLVGPQETAPIRQELYPFADAGALSYTPPHQRGLHVPSRGGWYRAGPELTLVLVAAGVPVPSGYAAPVPVTAEPPLTG